jgi:hypothetical protein
LVELSDSTGFAFTTVSVPGKPGDRVLVRDGFYLRFGHIIEKAQHSLEFNRSSLQLIAWDRDYSLAEYVTIQTDLAYKLVPLFLNRAGCPSKLIHAETVSYESRGLLRLKLSNPRGAHINEAVRLIIQLFCVAVEVTSECRKSSLAMA